MIDYMKVSYTHQEKNNYLEYFRINSLAQLKEIFGFFNASKINDIYLQLSNGKKYKINQNHLGILNYFIKNNDGKLDIENIEFIEL